MCTKIFYGIASAIIAATATQVVAQDNVMNQISPVARANQQFYLHPAHGFPGRPAGSTIRVVLNQVNPVASVPGPDQHPAIARRVAPTVTVTVIAGDVRDTSDHA